jgi:hypothetical protein
VPLSQRYSPEHPPGDTCTFGYDFSPLIPRGVTLVSASLSVLTNTAPPVDVTDLWTFKTVNVDDRTAWALLSGGVTGTDYILQWTAFDTDGNTWVRSGLVLCAPTS